MKEKFLLENNGAHNSLFRDMNNLNGSFLDMIDSVCTYKVELGVILQRLVECYNSVFLQQYYVFYRSKLDKEVKLEKEIQVYQDKQ